MNGAELIAQERQRQIDAEGYTPAHDRLHNDDSLACAAATYALPARSRDYKQLLDGSGAVPYHWPWGLAAWKPTRREWNQDHDEGYWDVEAVRCRVRDLSKAGALIAAEIDRLQSLVGGSATPADQGEKL